MHGSFKDIKTTPLCRMSGVYIDRLQCNSDLQMKLIPFILSLWFKEKKRDVIKAEQC